MFINHHIELTSRVPGYLVTDYLDRLNTAFYTTICGIIFSLPLQAQLMILRFKLEE